MCVLCLCSQKYTVKYICPFRACVCCLCVHGCTVYVCVCVFSLYLYQHLVHTKYVFCTGESRRTRNKRTNCMYICTFMYKHKLNIVFLTFVSIFQGPMGGNGPPGPPGVKVNAALFDLNVVSFVIINNNACICTHFLCRCSGWPRRTRHWSSSKFFNWVAIECFPSGDLIRSNVFLELHN